MADPEASLYKYKAKVLSCYDGDTVRLNLDLGMSSVLMKQKVRLWGINTPEVRGPSRPEGLISRDYLRSLILGKTVIIRTELDRKGKWGRILGIIYVEVDGEWICANSELVDKGLAVVNTYGEPFHGFPAL